MNSKIYKIPKEKVPVYQSLVLGVILDNLKMIKHAESLGADFTKVKLIDDRIDADSENTSNPLYISLADYVEKYSDNEIAEYITSKYPINADRKNKEILKTLSDHGSRGYSEKWIIEKIAPLVNSKNINEYFWGSSPENPISDESYRYKMNFLHVAIANTQLEVVEWLLSKGANPNAYYYFRNAIHGTAAELSMSTARSKKRRQTTHAQIILKLLNSGANFTKKNPHNSLSVWKILLNSLPLPVLTPLLMQHCPKDLEYYEIIYDRSKHLYKKLTEKYELFEKYPMINNIIKNEEVKVRFKETNSFIASKKFDSFLKEKSITQALSKRYGVSSSRMVKLVQDKFFRKEPGYISLDGRFLGRADFLKKLFIDELKNPFDFLSFLENNNSINELDAETLEKSEKIISFLIKYFTQDQIKTLLLSTEAADSLPDTLAMYKNVTKEYLRREMDFDLYFKEIPFSEISNFSDLHDFFEIEMEKIEREDFKIDQTVKFPKLKALDSISLPKGYGLKLATSNYELIDWGNRMDHCIGSSDYGEKALEGTSILLAITYEDKPKYAMEISSTGQLKQVQGYSSSKPELPVAEKVIQGLKKIEILKGKVNPKNWSENAKKTAA